MGYALKMFGRKKASFQHYETINKNVDGYNWDLINEDRKSIRSEPIVEQIKYINSK